MTTPRRAAAKAETHPALNGEPLVATEYAERIPAATVDKANEFIHNVTEQILHKSGFMCSVRVKDGEDEYRSVRVVTDSNSADAMAGRRNSTISSIQHLVDRMATRIAGEPIHVNVDINNYRQRKDGRLTVLTRDAMARVKTSGTPEHLPSMSARERRVVHMEVAEVDGLTTVTEGEDRDRHVIIKLEDAAE